MPSKFLTRLQRDDVLQMRLPSGGGYGPAKERDPRAVLADIAEEKVTPAHAEIHYPGVMSGDRSVPDEGATRHLRGREQEGK